MGGARGIATKKHKNTKRIDISLSFCVLCFFVAIPGNGSTRH
jgi:hypothetical protein